MNVYGGHELNLMFWLVSLNKIWVAVCQSDYIDFYFHNLFIFWNSDFRFKKTSFWL